MDFHPTCHRQATSGHSATAQHSMPGAKRKAGKRWPADTSCMTSLATGLAFLPRLLGWVVHSQSRLVAILASPPSGALSVALVTVISHYHRCGLPEPLPNFPTLAARTVKSKCDSPVPFGDLSMLSIIFSTSCRSNPHGMDSTARCTS